MNKGRLLSLVGGSMLIAASVLPYGYDEWASDSIFNIVRSVFNNLKNGMILWDSLLDIGLSNIVSVVLLGFVTIAFVLLVIGGLFCILRAGRGSVAGPVAMIFLTIVPLYLEGASELITLGIGYYIGWIGSVFCVLGAYNNDNKKRYMHEPKEDHSPDEYIYSYDVPGNDSFEEAAFLNDEDD